MTRKILKIKIFVKLMWLVILFSPSYQENQQQAILVASPSQPAKKSWVTYIKKLLPQSAVPIDKLVYQSSRGKILDMSNEHWLQLSYKQQQQYARLYQWAYAWQTGKKVSQTFTHKGAEFVLILIPPGRFWMGTDPNPRHRKRMVIWEAFWISRYEVTQAQWQKVTGQNPAVFHQLGGQAPVENISWFDCQKFCHKTGFQLPTEAQWEYACRAGTTTPFHLGRQLPASKANYNGNFPYQNGKKGVFRGHPTPVGTLLNSNAWGGYDFHGNVWEWCQSEYNSPQDAMHKHEYRIYRGGSWINFATACRSGKRNYWYPYHSSNSIGLRVIKH